MEKEIIFDNDYMGMTLYKMNNAYFLEIPDRENHVVEMELLFKFRRSDNTVWYDSHDNEAFMELAKLNNIDYDICGEYVDDNDCYYMFFLEKNSEGKEK